MKFSYKFSNLLGSVYRQGNLIFTQDGNAVISPVGNRITIFDLKNTKSVTLSLESSLNITAVALSPDGSLLIVINEVGEAELVTMFSHKVIGNYHFHSPVKAISFSPNGKKFAVTKENKILVFDAPGHHTQLNPFRLRRTYAGPHDVTVSIDWTDDSRVFCAGSEDLNTHVYAAEDLQNLVRYHIGGHKDILVSSFFYRRNSLDLCSISRNGQLCLWKSDTELVDLVGIGKRRLMEQVVTEGQEEDDDEDSEEEQPKKGKKRKKKQEQRPMVKYQQLAKHNYSSCRSGKSAKDADVTVTCVAMHKQTHIMCTGFSDGSFFLHDMPDFNMIHSLSISDNTITACQFNKSGDWLALGCSGLGQLLVWEWQSETYVLKQQGHFNNMCSLAYSPDGQHIATGAEDAKVKLWSTASGFCFVTFSEHLSAVMAVAFNHTGQVVLSASLDGTVRAFDLNRYRNFRTFTSPHPVQFSCLALDHSGEIICAGALDTYEIFVWSMQTGRLLEILTGHTSPVCSLSFDNKNAILASGSWDKTVRMWDVFQSKNSKEALYHVSDVLCVAYRPDGAELAVATLNAQISFWDVKTSQQTGTIEGRHDLGYSRKDRDKITAKKSSFGKAFNQLCYTADGGCILAGGISKNVCIYSVKDKMLIKKFEITCNKSLDGVVELLDRRKMTEWGSLALVEEADDPANPAKQIDLPGVKSGDFSSRKFKPQVRVTGLKFSPTGRAWAATCTEGLLVYSLDQQMLFDPLNLDIDITPQTTRSTSRAKQHSTAVMMAFRLNEQHLIREVVEKIPHTQVESVVTSLDQFYVDKLLDFVAHELESSPHLHFYLLWASNLMNIHGPSLKQRSKDIMPTLITMLKNLTTKNKDIGDMTDDNVYNLQYIKELSSLINKNKRSAPGEDDEEQSDEGEAEDDEDDDTSDDNIVDDDEMDDM